ncbi:hypothetical protein LCGC14_0506750 [marine sediment metagenome]|uniref:Uncharacterized protein n=1 Tax=marine sediment metagenome TaxID=412755 RepID=A0A0F9S2F3_9ZZZZ
MKLRLRTLKFSVIITLQLNCIDVNSCIGDL